jgi:hypothetical protein
MAHEWPAWSEYLTPHEAAEAVDGTLPDHPPAAQPVALRSGVPIPK